MIVRAGWRRERLSCDTCVVRALVERSMTFKAAGSIAVLAALAIVGSVLVRRSSRRGIGGKTSLVDTGLETTEGAATMPSKGDVHVVPSEKGWRVEVEGTTRASGTDRHRRKRGRWRSRSRVRTPPRRSSTAGTARSGNETPTGMTRHAEGITEDWRVSQRPGVTPAPLSLSDDFARASATNFCSTTRERS